MESIKQDVTYSAALLLDSATDAVKSSFAVLCRAAKVDHSLLAPTAAASLGKSKTC